MHDISKALQQNGLSDFGWTMYDIPVSVIFTNFLAFLLSAQHYIPFIQTSNPCSKSGGKLNRAGNPLGENIMFDLFNYENSHL